MSGAELFGLLAAALIGLGLYGLVVEPQPLRKILAFNLMGNGVFLLFGVAGMRGTMAGGAGLGGAVAGLGGDPVPQALVITGIVVAFAATALATALLLRLLDSGSASLRPPPADEAGL